MTRTPYMKRALGIVGITVMSFGLSACLQDKANWSQNDTIKRNSVTLHHLTHDLQFAADQTGITDAQAAELNRFLARSMAGYGDTFTIDSASDPASEDRREAIASYLRARGLEVSLQPAAFGGSVAPNAVRLILNRYVVTPPPCPDWRKPATTDFNNQVGSNFGCATETNLGLMVANPRDLVAGRSLGPSDAAAAAKAVQNYREDKVPDPKAVATQSGSGGSGGNSGGSK